MNISQIYVLASIICFAAIVVMILVGNRGKAPNYFTPLAGLAFIFSLAGLFFGETHSLALIDLTAIKTSFSDTFLAVWDRA